ncbi:MAG: glycerate kinase type-2 family protein, partial [Elusimicrobiota bacterium]
MAMGEIVDVKEQYFNQEYEITHQRYESLMREDIDKPLADSWKYMINLGNFHKKPREEKHKKQKEEEYQVIPVNTIRQANYLGKKVKDTDFQWFDHDIRGTMGVPGEEQGENIIIYIPFPFGFDPDTSAKAQDLSFLKTPVKDKKNIQHTGQSAINGKGVTGFVGKTLVIFNRAALLNIIPFPTFGRDLRLEEPPYVIWVIDPVSGNTVAVLFAPVIGGQQREIGERMYVISTQDYTELVGSIARRFYEEAVSNFENEYDGENSKYDLLKILGKKFIERANSFSLEEKEKEFLLKERRKRAELISKLGMQRAVKAENLKKLEEELKKLEEEAKKRAEQEKKRAEQEIRDIDLIMVQYANDFDLYQAADVEENNYDPSSENDYFYSLTKKGDNIYWKKLIPDIIIEVERGIKQATQSSWKEVGIGGEINIADISRNVPYEIEEGRSIILPYQLEENTEIILPAIPESLNDNFIKRVSNKASDQIRNDGEMFVLWPDIVEAAEMRGSRWEEFKQKQKEYFKQDYLVLNNKEIQNNEYLNVLFNNGKYTYEVEMEPSHIDNIIQEYKFTELDDISSSILNEAREKNLRVTDDRDFRVKVEEISRIINKHIIKNYGEKFVYPRTCAETTLLSRKVFEGLGYDVSTMLTEDIHYFLRVNKDKDTLIVDLTSSQFGGQGIPRLKLEVEKLAKKTANEEYISEHEFKSIQEMYKKVVSYPHKSPAEINSLINTFNKLYELYKKHKKDQKDIAWIDEKINYLKEEENRRQMTMWRESLIEIFDEAVKSVNPYECMISNLKYYEDKNVLQIGDRYYDMDEVNKLYVVGAGKASKEMARALNDLIGDKIAEGVINVYGEEQTKEGQIGKIKLIPAGHPQPNEKGIEGALEIQDILSKAGGKDMVITLISGGGSDLMALPEDGISLKDYKETVKLLKSAPLNIGQVNAVRKHIDKLKGGKLRITGAKAGNFVTLTLSDVPTLNDDPSVIASGPTVGDSTTFEDVYEILDEYELLEKIPDSVRNHIERGLDEQVKENPRASNSIFSPERSNYLIAGSNDVAIEAAKRKAEKNGYTAIIAEYKLDEEVNKEAERIFNMIKEYKNTNKPIALIWGGEPVVNIDVKEPGEGGRMAQLGLLIAKKLNEEGIEDVSFLGAGTDGIDGKSDIAGSVIDCETLDRLEEKGINVDEVLNNYNAASALKEIDGALKTDKTQTNVGDVAVALINPKVPELPKIKGEKRKVESSGTGSISPKKLSFDSFKGIGLIAAILGVAA